MRKILTILMLALSTHVIGSDDFSWITADGSKAPETENQKKAYTLAKRGRKQPKHCDCTKNPIKNQKSV
mgnify:CR=1 FL=1